MIRHKLWDLMGNPYCQRRGGTYYLRLRIPADLRPILGSQVMRSLRTGRPGEARTLAAGLVAAAPRWWAVLRAEVMAHFLGKSIDELTIEDISRANLARMTADLAAMPEEERERVYARMDELIRMHTTVTGWLEEDYRPARFALDLMQHGHTVGLNKALALAGSAQRRPDEQPSPTPLPAPVPVPAPAYAPSGKVHAKARLTLSELSEEFFESEGQGESSVKSHQSAFRHFADACGDKPVGRITEDDLVKFRKYCIKLPGKDGREQAARATVQKHLSHVKNLLAWAANPERRYLPSNPGVHIKPPKKPKGATNDGVRLAFDEAQLTRIFHCPLYTGHHRIQLKRRGPCLVREDRFYFFLCMYLTGARNDELPGADIYDLVDVPCLDLTRTGTKTPAGPRVVPILPELRATGFLTWARARLASGGRLFRGPHAVANWNNFPSRYLREIGVGDRLHSAYSLRHSHRQMLRGASLTDELIDKTFGHEGTKVGAGYGRGIVTLQEARAWLKGVRSSIDLSHLFVERGD